MSKFWLTALLLAFVASVGCNSQPDPREAADFNEAALEDPMAIQMDTLQ
jgi:hypothetical protein